MEIKEDLEYQLDRINNWIKNTEYDLKGLFKDNPVVIDKLNRLKEQKLDVEKKLQNL